ncbi:MAG: hypothetical protein IIX75_03475, partial [Clostridia bacterium]|nr:hypothetical protein [Clostridia bacterium]
MKKVIGVLVIFLLVATLALVVTGVYRILNMPDVRYEDPDNVEDKPADDGKEDDKQDGDSDGSQSGSVDTGTQPDPEIEYGTVADRVVSMDIPEDERTGHMLSFEVDSNAALSAESFKVKLYFGSFIKLDSIENSENATVEIVLTNEEGDRIVIAEIPAKDFYSDKYACVQDSVEDTVVGVR